MLIGNYSVLNKTAGRWLGGVSHATTRANFNTTNASRNRFVGQASWDSKAAQPNGYLPPSSWVLPRVSGGMSSTILGSSFVLLVVPVAGDLEASLSGLGDLLGTIKGAGTLSADIVVGASDPLSPQALAAAVWNALAVEFNDTGSFGELVQNNVGVDYDRIMREVRDALVAHIWAAS